MKTIGLLLLSTAILVAPGRARADLSVGAWIQSSPDDLNTTNVPGLLTLSGNDATATATMPFSITIGGTSYSTIVISTNGWIEFGSNTQGTSDPTNASLPTSKHTNPFLAAYWDDLDTFDTNIRYGVVGTSPWRTYIVDAHVDVDPANEGGSADDLRFQVQIHESSQVINVHYDSSGHIANGQAATIGFQTAGGSGATAFPLTFNGKVMDDNNNNEGWSIDLHKTGAEAMSAMMACSPDDIGADTPAFTTLSGNDAIAGVTMPFSITIEGTSYSTVTIGTNGLVQFGTTTGANPTTNTALPSSSFPNPTLFWFWDNLQTEGNNIRYGTVGTSPNRTFIIDFQENQVSSTGDKVNGQVQIHERSNLINVKYRDPLSVNSNGQTATIGFQGAGGSSAAVYPLTFNGKILDDNRPNEGWSAHAQPTKDVSLHALHEYSPDDIPGAGFTSLSGDNAIAGVTLPFSVVIDGVSYSTATIGTNGLVQFGTTTGANPATNAALPSASFPNPTLFWYWDDLQTFSSNIEYNTVGTSPNRTFIIDFQENRVGDTGTVVNGQVQIHEGSNEMNVQYRSTTSANGNSATIGFQGAGGASAKAYALTFNGKILDDNLPDSGWSVSPLRYCGDGIIQSGAPFNEQCDLGASNGVAGSCCTASCTFVPIGTLCRSSAGECDPSENCAGNFALCPPDGKSLNGTACTSDGNPCTLDQCDGTNNVCQHPAGNAGATCRAQADVCDVAETCTGTSTTCPANGFASSTTVCRPSAGACDPAESCTGTSAACPFDTLSSSTTPCRPAVGECDLTESCTGSSATCPGDAKRPSGTACTNDANPCTTDTCDGASDACQHPAGNAGAVCRPGSGDLCDPDEVCTGLSTACPTDVFLPNTFECRSAAGECDIRETCGGTPGQPCPADVKKASGTACTADSNPCTADQCDGTDNDCQHPAGNVGVVCRSSAGACDIAETCTGTSTTCPFDAKSTAACRPAAGPCDITETCDGSNDDCPADGFAASSIVCRPTAGECDVAESCTGSDASCPADAKQPSGFACTSDENPCTLDECDGTNAACQHPAGNAGVTCRSSAGDCDVAETCDGTSTTCPADAFEPSTTVCRSAAGVCDVAENCTGTSADCPSDAKSTAVCRSATGGCDATETCDGIGDDCPPDAVSPSGSVCRAAAGGCDIAEACDGSSTACPADAVVPGGTECRAAAGVCDVAESCDGTSPSCPADAFEPSTVVCRSSAGDCDVPESCTGSSAACPSDSVAGAFVQCRAAAGPCDQAENCTGSSTTCPADAFQPNTTTCRAAAGPCDLAETCTGTGTACPADAKSTAVCRSSAGACDVAESCDGSSNTCPADAFQPVGTTCRSATGTCDVAEVCTGLAAACPPDVAQPNGTPCNDGNACTQPDACQAGACVGAPDPTICNDHYLCYKSKGTGFTPPPPAHLVDQFEDVTATIVKPKVVCTPADKNGEGTTDANTHLRGYTFKQVPPHARRTVTTTNQFGSLSLTTTKPDLLFVPTSKDLVTPPSAPDLNTINVNHYKCYKVKVTSGTPHFPKGVQALVTDQFTSPQKRFDVRKPKHLCNPVDKNSEGLKNADAHLVCYQVKPAKGQPKHVRRTAFVNNQFSPETVTTLKESELCVPSIKTP